MRRPGLFITFEGGEGSGKTTQLKRLGERLRAAGVPVIATREPGGSPGAEELRRLVVEGEPGRWDAVAETLLFLAARRNHWLSAIRPALEDGQVVFCDRFTDSTLVYQGVAKGLGVEYVEMLSRLSVPDAQPDLTLLFDLSPQEGLQRAEGRAGGEGRFESLGAAFHEQVRQGFLTLQARFPQRIRRIDASDGIDAVERAVLNTLHERFPQHFSAPSEG